MLVKFVSINQTIGRFLKEFGVEDTTYVDDLPQWVEDAIEIIGIPGYYVNKHKVLEVIDNRCNIPCDVENLTAVFVTSDLRETQEVSSLYKLPIRNMPLLGQGVKTTAVNHAAATINGNFLHTTFNRGHVYFAYQGIPCDCDGFPLVPKDAKFNEAIQYYFIYRMALSGYKHPIIDFKTAHQMWEKTYPAAGNSLNWMDAHDLKEFTDMWTNPILGDLPSNNYHV